METDFQTINTIATFSCAALAVCLACAQLYFANKQQKTAQQYFALEHKILLNTSCTVGLLTQR